MTFLVLALTAFAVFLPGAVPLTLASASLLRIKPPAVNTGLVYVQSY